MKIEKMLVTLGALAKENAPAILTGVSIIAGGGAVITGMAAQHKADETIHGMSEEDQKDPKKVVKEVWKFYIPPVALYATSVGCSIGAYKSGDNRYKALMAASAMGSDKVETIAKNVEEKLGLKSDEENTNDDKEQEVVKFTESSRWFYEPRTNTTFRTKPSELYTSCVWCISTAVHSDGWISITDIIEGCDDVEYETGYVPECGERYGWDVSIDGCGAVVPNLTKGFVRNDGLPCIELNFNNEPTLRI